MPYVPTPAPTLVPDPLVLKYWAKQIWKSGIDESYFKRFMGRDSKSIIHIKEELSKGPGTSINIPLRMPLFGAGVIEDERLEGKEEALTFREFDVYLSRIRHGVRLKGEFEEQKTQIDLRKESKAALSEWLGKYIDLSLFSILTGTPFPLIQAATDVFPFTIEPPTPDRILFSGSLPAVPASEQLITASDVFTTELISQAKRAAIKDEVTAIRPVRVDGKDHYIMLIDHWQARDLRRDPAWLEAQQHANIRGNNNPIFSGAIGMWDGVVIHENGRVPRTDSGQGSTFNATTGTYTGGVMVGHALLLGAQAVVFAEGKPPRMRVKLFDYDNEFGVSIDRFFGLKRAMFKYDGTNYTDFGCLNVMTSSVED